MGKIVKNGISYSGNITYKQLTQAQYDALPNTKLTDGIQYYITDAEYITANDVPYGNTTVKGALDDVNDSLTSFENEFITVNATTGTLNSYKFTSVASYGISASTHSVIGFSIYSTDGAWRSNGYVAIELLLIGDKLAIKAKDEVYVNCDVKVIIKKL